MSQAVFFARNTQHQTLAPIVSMNPKLCETSLPTINPASSLPVISDLRALPRRAAEPELGLEAIECCLWRLGFCVFRIGSLGLVRPTVEAGLRWWPAGRMMPGTMPWPIMREPCWRLNMRSAAHARHDERVTEYLTEAKAGGRFVRGLNEKTAFHNPQFVKELEEVGDAKFVGGNHIEFLHDGLHLPSEPS